MTTNKMTSAEKSSDFRDMGISEMNSTHHFGYETSSKQFRIIEFVGCDLIVKYLFQGVNRGGEKFYNASYATAGVFGILEKGLLEIHLKLIT